MIGWLDISSDDEERERRFSIVVEERQSAGINGTGHNDRLLVHVNRRLIRSPRPRPSNHELIISNKSCDYSADFIFLRRLNLDNHTLAKFGTIVALT